MPGSSDEQDVPRRRTPRRRTASSREEREVREPRVSRRVARRDVPAPEPEVNTSAVLESRKAPTPLAAEKEGQAEKKKKLMIALAILLVGVGASAAVGISDRGPIDVQQTIEARNERIRNNQADESDTITTSIEVPVQDSDSVDKVDGGLLGREVGYQDPNAVVVASTTATSTDMAASSTEAVASSTDGGTGVSEDEAQPSAAPQEETEIIQ